MILAMTKLIIEWENVRIPNKKPDGKEMGDSGRQEVMKNTVCTKVTGNFSEKTKETGKQTTISNFFTTNNTRYGDFGFKRKLNDGVGVQSARPSKRKCDNKKTEKDAKSAETEGCDKGASNLPKMISMCGSTIKKMGRMLSV